MRKILFAIVIVIVLAVIGTGIYFAFFAPKSTPAGTTPGQTGNLPPTGNQYNPGGSPTGGPQTQNPAAPSLAKNFGVIATDPVIDYFVTPKNTVIAVEPTGKVITVDNGQATIISALAIQNIISVSFSRDGSKLLVSFGDPANPQASIFDVVLKAWIPLPAGWQSPVWSPMDNRIAYAKSNANGMEVFATVNAGAGSKTTVSAPTILTTLHAQDLAITWPNKNQFVLYEKSSNYVAGSAWLFDAQKQSLAPIFGETNGLTISWNNALGLVFSAGDLQLGGSLRLIDTSGNSVARLKFVTLPSKCNFAVATTTAPAAVSSTGARSAAAPATTSTSYLYCGIPRDQQKLSISHLPDDYNQKALYTSDDVYRVNLSSGAIESVFANPAQNLDVSDVKAFNNAVFFINRYDQKLYGIQLAVGS